MTEISLRDIYKGIFVCWLPFIVPIAEARAQQISNNFANGLVTCCDCIYGFSFRIRFIYNCLSFVVSLIFHLPTHCVKSAFMGNLKLKRWCMQGLILILLHLKFILLMFKGSLLTDNTTFVFQKVSLHIIIIYHSFVTYWNFITLYYINKIFIIICH